MNTTITTSSMPMVMTSASSLTIKSAASTASEIFDKYEMNELTVEHKVQEFELMKLRETDVNYAEVIKENLAKMASREVIKKASFTKKKDLDTETTSFRARVWVFTKDELNQLIEDIRNGI